MKTHAKFVLLMLVAMVVSLSCYGPFYREPTAAPDLEQTITAIYASGILNTATQAPFMVVTATPEPATQTSAPTETVMAASPTPSHTTTFTVTPVTPTVKALPQRGGGLIQAVYLSSSPDIDGSWAGWDSPFHSANFVVYGNKNWTDEDDLSASYRIGWNEDYLFIAVKVKDDHYVQNASGQNLYLGDSIEILLDTNLYDDFHYNQLSADDYQLGISPGKGGVDGTREAVLWYPRDYMGSKSNVKIGSMGGDGIYRVEARIPWSVFNVTPSNGKHFGFALSVSDNDNNGWNEQQSMVSSAGNRHLTQPMTWGELVLAR